MGCRGPEIRRDVRTEKALREDSAGELEASIGDEAGRHAVRAVVEKPGRDCAIPQNAGEHDRHAGKVATAEHVALAAAKVECRAVEATFRGLGYRVHTLQNEWRRVRRYQAVTNFVAERDRLLVPIFPDSETLLAHTLPLPGGHRLTALRARQEYRLEGVNRRA